MTEDREDISQATRIGEAFRKLLNAHGHVFQRRVWRAVREMREGQQANWVPVVYEFPVETRDGRTTSIDLILRRKGDAIFLIVECKRANPALSNWCFARGLKDHRERVGYEQFGGTDNTFEIVPLTSPRIFGVALECRADEKGDPAGEGRGAIESAVTQVLRATHALIDTYLPSRLLQLWSAESGGVKDSVVLLPVVVTTATLWTSEVELETADLVSGELESGSVAVVPKPWLFYRYHMTPALRQKRVPPHDTVRSHTLAELLNRDFARPVAIVNVEGLGDFLSNVHSSLY